MSDRHGRPGWREIVAPDGAVPPLTLRQLNRTTLLRQSLRRRSADDPATAIHRLAGLQAQYANSPYVALWSRLRDFAIADLEKALDDRSVVKASAIRNTLHLVAAVDYPAFSVASGAARIANWRPSARRAGLDMAELHRHLLRFARKPRTIAEMEADLEVLASDASLAQHVPSGVRHVAFQMASTHGWLVHVPPSGNWDSFSKPRYVDAGIWLPDAVRPDEGEALRYAMERYLGAYGPASVADIGRWIGQPRLARVREAIDSLGDRVRRFLGPDDRELVDLVDAPLASGDEPAPGRFLARWDSVIIGYEGRERILPEALAPAVIIRKNGDFQPSFTVDGFVAGTWSVSSEAGTTTLEIKAVAAVPKAARSELTDEAERLAAFISRAEGATRVRWAG
jgi:hypothetical protein